MLRQMRAATLTSYVEVARFVGLEPFEFLRSAGIRPEDLEDPEYRLPAKSVVNLLEESASISGSGSFGLLMAQCRTFAQFGPLSLLLERLPTVRDSIEALSEYRRHINDILDIDVEDDGSTCLIRFNLLPEYAKTQIVDLTVARGFRNIAGASGGHWSPASVHLIHKAPDDLAVFRRYYPCTVEFESDFNGLACSSRSMATPNPLADPDMARHAMRLLNLVALRKEHAPFSDSVRRSINLFLPTGTATLEHVAANLGLSPRALQRGLEKEDQAFGSLLNEVRRELAKQYLSTSNHSVTVISDLTGYTSSSSFTRWFAREFGTAPHIWRAQQMEVRSGLPGMRH